MKYCAFDIETAKPAPEDYNDYSLGVTCAAIFAKDGDRELKAVFVGEEQDDGCLAPQMSALECWRFMVQLLRAEEKGYTIVSFNGLGFDFRVLAESVEPWRRPEVARLALDHTDPGFHMLCVKGFMAGLSAASMGMGIGDKTEGMDGLAAIEMWKQGREAQEKVLDYVQQDARLTADVYANTLAAGELRWLSKKKRLNTWSLGEGGFLPVCKAMELPVPKISWMKPWPRERFIGWALKEAK